MLGRSPKKDSQNSAAHYEQVEEVDRCGILSTLLSLVQVGADCGVDELRLACPAAAAGELQHKHAELAAEAPCP
jgi:hypothetical protein